MLFKNLSLNKKETDIVLEEAQILQIYTLVLQINFWIPATESEIFTLKKQAKFHHLNVEERLAACIDYDEVVKTHRYIGRPPQDRW
jgi:hypothetical protein